MNKNARILTCLLIMFVVACGCFSVGFICCSGLEYPDSNNLTDDLAELHIPTYLYNSEPIYVIGHKKPDMDAVCSAIGLANLLKEHGVNAVPATSDPLCLEAERVLDRYGIEHPIYLTDASGKQVILVDHSQYHHGVNGIENAKILGIVDHHHLGDIQTDKSIFVLNEPVGATASIIISLYEITDTNLDEKTAKLLLAALLDDTNKLRASSTAALDFVAFKELKKVSGISDTDELFNFICKAETDYGDMTDEQIIHRFEKSYNMGSHTQTIAYVKVMGKEDMDDMTERMKKVMKNIYPTHTAEHMYIVMIDLENNTSELLYYGDGIEKYVNAAFTPDSSGRILFNTIVSRKEEIIPPLKKAYEKDDE